MEDAITVNTSGVEQLEDALDVIAEKLAEPIVAETMEDAKAQVMQELRNAFGWTRGE